MRLPEIDSLAWQVHVVDGREATVSHHLALVYRRTGTCVSISCCRAMQSSGEPPRRHRGKRDDLAPGAHLRYASVPHRPSASASPAMAAMTKAMCSYCAAQRRSADARPGPDRRDRKSTRLNSSHTVISYTVFC